MSGQHNGWGRELPQYLKSPILHQMHCGPPMLYQSSSRGANYVNTPPPISGPHLLWPAPSCSSVGDNQQGMHLVKHRTQVEQTIPPVLTTIVPNSDLPIPVLSSVRREKSTFLNEVKVKNERESEVECNNNNITVADESRGPARRCSMCVGNTVLGEEALRRHLKIHYDAMFKCGICRRGFEKLSEAVQHQDKRHADKGNIEVVWPAVSRLLSARCRLRGCKRELIGVTGTEVEEHLKAVHEQGGKKASTKRSQAFEWRCRVCHNSGRRLGGESAALAHVRSHCPGEDDCDASDTTSGGFSSASSCEEQSLSESPESDCEIEADAVASGNGIATSNNSAHQADGAGAGDLERAQVCALDRVEAADAGSNAEVLNKSQ